MIDTFRSEIIYHTNDGRFPVARSNWKRRMMRHLATPRNTTKVGDNKCFAPNFPSKIWIVKITFWNLQIIVASTKKIMDARKSTVVEVCYGSHQV